MGPESNACPNWGCNLGVGLQNNVIYTCFLEAVRHSEPRDPTAYHHNSEGLLWFLIHVFCLLSFPFFELEVWSIKWNKVRMKNPYVD